MAGMGKGITRSALRPLKKRKPKIGARRGVTIRKNPQPLPRNRKY